MKSRLTLWLAGTCVFFGAYFAIACVVSRNYVPVRPPGVIENPMLLPYGKFGVWIHAVEFEDLSDSNDHPNRSPFMIYEDGKPLGPAHAPHADIANLGHGRFSHWTKIGFLFSSSDGTDPIKNGRIYRAVKVR